MGVEGRESGEIEVRRAAEREKGEGYVKSGRGRDVKAADGAGGGSDRARFGGKREEIGAY